MELMEERPEMNRSVSADENGEDPAVASGADIPAHVMRRILSARAFRENARRIDDVTSFVSRAVKTLSDKEGVSLHSDALALLENISREEDHIFSKIPDDMREALDKKKAVVTFSKRKANGKRDAGVEVSTEHSPRRDHGTIIRFIIDPNTPLPMPHNPVLGSLDPKKQTNGHYHELFFGDRDAIVFQPPENNKRKDLEKRRKEKLYWENKMKRPAKEIKLETGKVLKVPRDFVPACAEVDHSAEQEKLQLKKSVDSERNLIIFR
ncbi:hypothetical protein, conserved [Trypanosoma brucei gambiense DAL972]|uniref:Uncharacterized protein n=1 Tax=Trypanosoma brucei gambiense (strain MHOM/CI/86/DAL972) TaxID=679716 RepID=D0A5K5_TRYB9|nr:hypothetical protein, conserved [Trypanosoma brucei gambiense DAL972]CBH16956.1 hypothetical protein, conserved [Trypanosoma brucei gambiense DAL972]|eukprot:XP_011779220.1 hypothetical protein, conserved [Trypanosoma brucei gambiense DAL972]